MCILCFLEDSYQANLKARCQRKDKRFELVLADYQTLFFEEFKKESDDFSSCPKHHYLYVSHLDDVRKVYDKFEECWEDINSFFNTILEIYKDWIGNNSVSKIDKLFEDVLSTCSISENVFFRGRNEEKLDRVKEELFHIPFDQRYKINNQRFSVSGQPLLYLGLSILDIIYELRKDFLKKEDYKNLIVSSFYVDCVNDIKLSCYDLRNPFNGFPYKGEAKFNILDLDIFKRFVLSQVCSFKNFNSGSFSEEYVIPQLITKYIYRNRIRLKIDGLVYNSAVVPYEWEIKLTPDEIIEETKFRNNFVLFVDYDENERYSPSMKKFIVSEPVGINDKLENYDITKLKEDIKSLGLNLDVYNLLTQLEQNENIILKSKNLKYSDHQVGKLEQVLFYKCVKAKFEHQKSKAK